MGRSDAITGNEPGRARPMRRRPFGSLEHEKVKGRRQEFLERMETLVHWEELKKRIAPIYPKPGRGQCPCPLRVMLRIHCL